MKTSQPPPRSSAIGPLASMSHVERSVTCLHCQKVHNAGFIWSFSDKIRVCFTCYREMGEEGRKSYERGVVVLEKSERKAEKRAKAGTAMKVLGVLALLALILTASSYFFCRPLTEADAEQLVAVRGNHMSARQ